MGLKMKIFTTLRLRSGQATHTGTEEFGGHVNWQW